MFTSTFLLRPSSRQPFTTTAFLPLWACHYCHYLLAVLAILPHTYTSRLAHHSMAGFELRRGWISPQGWQSRWDVTAWIEALCVCGARSFFVRKRLLPPSLNYFLLMHACYGLLRFTITLRSLEWAFAKKPLMIYESPADGQQQRAPVERRLSIPNVLLDAFDLTCGYR